MFSSVPLQAGNAKVFISHGLQDPLFPIAQTSRKIVPQLRQLAPKKEIKYVEFQGKHEVPAAISKQALEWALLGTSTRGDAVTQRGR